MLKIYQINGVDYPCVFDHYSIYDYEQQTGRPFAADFQKLAFAMSSDAGNLPMVILTDIIRCGFIAGAAQLKKSFNLSARELFSIIPENMETVSSIILQCAESLPKRKAEEDLGGEGEAKGVVQE
jgi:hypothetical protein